MKGYVMRRMMSMAGLVFIFASAPVLEADVPAMTYKAKWESLNARPCPQWWKDAKFGIFVHWGVYSVPAFSPYDMWLDKSRAFAFSSLTSCIA